jgi:hypothetical protein
VGCADARYDSGGGINLNNGRVFKLMWNGRQASDSNDGGISPFLALMTAQHIAEEAL